jgi:hypothetical protein
MRHSSTITESIAIATKVVEVDDDVRAAGVTVTHPYPSHLVLKAVAGLTVGGRVAVTFTGGEPPAGHELTITVVQSASSATPTGRISDVILNVAGTDVTPGFHGIQGTDYSTPSPHDGETTVFKFVYSGQNYYYTKVYEGVGVSSPPSVYVFDLLTNYSPHKSRDVLRGGFDKMTQAGNPYTQCTNAVHVDHSTFRGGVTFWVAVSGGTGYLLYMTQGFAVKRLSLGAVSGTVERLAIRKVASTTPTHTYQMMLQTSDTLYRLRVSESATTAGLMGTPDLTLLLANGHEQILYKDQFDDKFYFALNGTLSSRAGDFSGGDASILTVPGGRIIRDIAMTPEGHLCILYGNTDGFIRLAPVGLGEEVVDETSFEAASQITGLSGSPPRKMAYDRNRGVWLVIDVNGAVYRSTTQEGGSWSQVSDFTDIDGFDFHSYGLPDVFEGVGNAIVATKWTANVSYTLMSVDSGANWDVLAAESSGGSLNTPLVFGVQYHNGRLFSPLGNSDSILVSKEPCGRWGYLDFDK